MTASQAQPVLSNRRQWLGTLSTVLPLSLVLPRNQAADSASAAATRGSAPLTITRVRAIVTKPDRFPLVVVKVETSEPGLYGLGCATFTQRATLVAKAVDDFLDPFARGRDATQIEDLWQGAYTSSYWRNGPVLNNALSGLDMALWDILGKRAGLPVYQLLGGKCRFAVEAYARANGDSIDHTIELAQVLKEQGFRHIRLQVGSYGGTQVAGPGDFRDAGFGMPEDQFIDEPEYLRTIPKLFAKAREKLGSEVELLHDIHERIAPRAAIRLIRDLEPHRPFFIEDPFPPEPNLEYFRQLRQQTSVPIAMGELFNNPHEWDLLLKERLIDYLRVHVSQIGGLSPARKLAAVAEHANVKTAWHGPPDESPVGHAASAHLDLAIHNFGIQEISFFNQATLDVFPGSPTYKKGMMWINEAPGFGVGLDEGVAAKFPPDQTPNNWTPVRRRDGSITRP